MLQAGETANEAHSDPEAVFELIGQAAATAGAEVSRIALDSQPWSRDLFQDVSEAEVLIVDLPEVGHFLCYLLGLRHGLRASGTIVLAEGSARHSLPLTSMKVHPYPARLDEREDGRRFREELAEAIATVLAGDEHDSPVYLLLPNLRPAGTLGPIGEPAP